jgi:hypothetical protein
MPDAVPELAVGFGITGGMVLKAVEGNIPVEEDRIEGDDLFGAQVVHGFLEGFELVNGLLGRLRWVGRCLGGVVSTGLGSRADSCGEDVS